MLSFRTVLPHTLELLEQLSALPEFADTRLVGGTALALQYGHRSSVDLNFFGAFDVDTDFNKVCSQVGAVTDNHSSRMIRSFLLDGVKIDIVNYSRYKWIDPAVTSGAICLASPRDIAAMKINAIEGRGSKKDFIDMYFLLKHYSLEEILSFYSTKYPEHSTFRALMSLQYFNDAEIQPMPNMFIPTEWEEVKQNITGIVKEFR